MIELEKIEPKKINESTETADGNKMVEATQSSESSEQFEEKEIIERINIFRRTLEKYVATKQQLSSWDNLLGEMVSTFQEEINIRLKEFYLPPPGEHHIEGDLVYEKLVERFKQRGPIEDKKPGEAGYPIQFQLGNHIRWEFQKLDNPEMDAFPITHNKEYFYIPGTFKIREDRIKEFEREESCLAESLMHRWSYSVDFIYEYPGHINHRYALELLRYKDDVKDHISINEDIRLPSLEEYEADYSLRGDYHHKVVDAYFNLGEKSESVEYTWWNQSNLRCIIAKHAIYAENFEKPVENALERMEMIMKKFKAR